MALIPKLKITDIDDNHVALAWTLVTSLHSDLTLEDWTIFCRKILTTQNQNMGIITAQDDRGYLHGLYSYERLHDCKQGDFLEIKNFVAVDLYGRSAVAEQMIATMEERAQQLECSFYQVILPNPASSVQGTTSLIGKCLHAHGHIVSGSYLTKAVDIPTC